MPFLTPQLVSILVSLALGFGGGWLINGWRMGVEISQIKQERAESIAKGITQAMTETAALQRKKDDALKKAESRAVANGAAAAAATTELERMRVDLSDARSDIGRATESSLRVHAATINTLFNECGTTLTDMARKAQGHASDVQTLIDAWPTKGN